MSRSYKKHPIAKSGDGTYRAIAKKYANKKVRRCDDELPTKGNYYRRLYPQWDVCEYRNRLTWEEMIFYEYKRYRSWRKPRDIKQLRKDWESCWYRK